MFRGLLSNSMNRHAIKEGGKIVDLGYLPNMQTAALHLYYTQYVSDV